MIYKLQDTARAAPLFEGQGDSLILSCLEGVMGAVLVTDPENPRSALAAGPCFSFYAGEPDRELVSWRPRGEVGMVPPDEAWARLIEECWPQAEKATRYALKADAKFDPERLRRTAAALPEGYTLRKIDEEIYEQCRASELFRDCVTHFGSRERFFALGRGFAVMKGGKLASAASSFSVYSRGVEIEIDTLPEERRRGLAGAAGAALILSCLADGLRPHWDAANPVSLHLAEKLGYEFSHEYDCWWLDEEGVHELKKP